MPYIPGVGYRPSGTGFGGSTEQTDSDDSSDDPEPWRDGRTSNVPVDSGSDDDSGGASRGSGDTGDSLSPGDTADDFEEPDDSGDSSPDVDVGGGGSSSSGGSDSGSTDSSSDDSNDSNSSSGGGFEYGTGATGESYGGGDSAIGSETDTTDEELSAGAGGRPEVSDPPEPDSPTRQQPEPPDASPGEQGLEETGSTTEQYSVTFDDQTFEGSQQEIAQRVEGQLAGEQISRSVDGVNMSGASWREEDIRVEERDGGLGIELTDAGRQRVNDMARRQESERIERELEQRFGRNFDDEDVTVEEDGSVNVSGDVQDAAAEQQNETYDTDVSPSLNRGTGQQQASGDDSPQDQIVSKLEEQTGADLDREDVAFEETEDGSIRGTLNDQGERDVARQTAPFQNTPLGGVFAEGAEIRTRIDQAGLGDEFDERTPNEGDVRRVVGDGIDTIASADVPFTDTQYRDVPDAVTGAIPDSPDGTNPLLYRAGVEGKQALTGMSEQEAEAELSADIQATRDDTYTAFTPAVGRSPAGAGRAVSSGAVARGGAVVGGAVAAAGANEVANDNSGELEPGSAVPSAEVEVPDETQTGELQVSDGSVEEVGVGETVPSSEVDVPTDQSTPLDQLQANQQLVGQQQERREQAEQQQIPLEDVIDDDPFGDIEQPAPTSRERQRRDDLNPFERTFPTGGSAVVGEESVNETLDRAEESQQSEVTQPTDTDAGTGQRPGQGVGVGPQPGVGTDPAEEVGQTPSDDVGLDQPAAQQPAAETSSSFESTPEFLQNNNRARVRDPTEDVFGEGGGSGSRRPRLEWPGDDEDDDGDPTDWLYSSQTFDTGVLQDIDDALR